MKYLKNQVFILVMFTTLIGLQSCFQGYSEKISGNGNVSKQNREVSSFNAIDASGVFNIYLAQGDKESLTVEADENLLPYLKTEVDNHILRIDVKDRISIKHAKKKNVYITLVDINRLKIKTVGNIETTGIIHLNELELSHSGVGNTELELDCKKLVADIHSVGDVTIRGKATEAVIKNSSVGNTNANDFYVDILKINNSSVGNVEVRAEKEISIESSGIGNVTFSGEASVKQLTSNGVGKVHKK